ncbi:MAG: tRNA (adenosine(37)-N6)-dimethylallyltransferase MiaA [Patescibacteria group bacterium]
MKDKIIAIIGPTASGKSDLAVRLAKRFSARGGPALGWKGAEIISADSRQVYRGLNIGSGKITKREMRGIPHHLLDVVKANSPKRFSVSDYQKLGQKAIGEIIKRGKLPIICGGTGFYVDALLKNYALPAVPPNPKLRGQLEKLPTEKLAQKLKILDPKRFKNIDRNNRPRLIRAIEIATKLGQVPPLDTKNNSWNSLQIGINLSEDKLRQNIHKRLLKRLRAGLINEVKKLHENGVSWKRLEAFGLEYRFGAKLLQQKPRHGGVNREEITNLEREIWHYAKRQMTWWKRDKNIKWVESYEEAERLTRDFIRK